MGKDLFNNKLSPTSLSLPLFPSSLSLVFSLSSAPLFSKIYSCHLTIPFSHSFRRNFLTSLKMLSIENEILHMQFFTLKELKYLLDFQELQLQASSEQNYPNKLLPRTWLSHLLIVPEHLIPSSLYIFICSLTLLDIM